MKKAFFLKQEDSEHLLESLGGMTQRVPGVTWSDYWQGAGPTASYGFGTRDDGSGNPIIRFFFGYGREIVYIGAERDVAGDDITAGAPPMFTEMVQRLEELSSDFAQGTIKAQCTKD